MAWPEIAACLLSFLYLIPAKRRRIPRRRHGPDYSGHVAIGEGAQERDDGKLLHVVQSKIPHLGCVDVVGHFWQRPSRAGNVPRVVEVNDLLQRLEVAIV